MSENIINLNNYLTDEDNIISLPSFLMANESEESVSVLSSEQETTATCTTVYQTCGACESSTQCGTCQHTVQCDLCVEVQCTSCVWSCNSTECSSCENDCMSCVILCDSCMEEMCRVITQGGCSSCESGECSGCESQQTCDGACETVMSCTDCELTQCIPCEAAQTCVVGCLTEEGCAISQGCSDVALETSICSQGTGLGGGVSGVSPNNGGSFYVTITGLQYPFNTTNYRDIVITKTNYGESTSSISSYMALKTPTTSGTANSVAVHVTNSGYGTFTIYAYAYTNKYYLAGTFEVTVLNSVTAWSWASTTRTALTNKGLTTNLRYGEWNLFIEKIKEILIFKGFGDTTVGVSTMTSNNLIVHSSTVTLLTLLNSAKASASGEIMTAQKFNTIRYAVGILAPTSINIVQDGDIVYGSYFIILETKLNSVL